MSGLLELKAPTPPRPLILLGILGAVIGCSTPSPVNDLALERRGQALALADPVEPIGVSATGLTVARVVFGTDTSFRLFDSTGATVGPASVPGIGVWLADEAGAFHTLAPGALGVVALNPDGSAGPAIRFQEPGVVRAMLGDSVDVMRLFGDGFKVVRVAAGGTGEREILDGRAPQIAELLGIGPRGAGQAPSMAALPAVTTRADRVVVGNGGTYQLLLFDAAGKSVGAIQRTLPAAPLTSRQIEGEISQLQRSQKLSEQYLTVLRQQLAKGKMPFFSSTQGMRFDGAGRLWVVGYEADSAFADVFSDTTFVRRFSLSCPGFDGSWDLKGEWLAVACGSRDVAAQGGELTLYRITAPR